MGKMTKSEIIKELESKIEEFDKKLESERSLKEMYQRNSSEYQKQIDEMHSVFDGLDGCCARFVEKKERYGGCSDVEMSLQARFASFMNSLINK
jgi:hypothetical protein